MRKIKRGMAMCLTIIASLSFMSQKAYACDEISLSARKDLYYFFNLSESASRGYNAPRYADRLAEEWSKMLGRKVEAQEINDLATEPIADMKDFENHPFLKYALGKKDAEMAEYLRDLAFYLNFTNVIRSQNSWYYPSKKDLEDKKINAQKLLDKVQNMKSQRFGKQYRLMKMRLLFNDAQYAKCIEMWNAEKATVDMKNVFDDMLTDYYAGALFRTGKKDEAATVYAQLGDKESLVYCMGKNQNVQYLRELVNNDPNSPAIPFVLDILVNNALETIEYEKQMKLFNQNPAASIFYKNDFREEKWFIRYHREFSIPKKNRTDLMELAKEMSQRNDVKDKCMWLTSVAYMNYLTDDIKNANTNIDLAMKANGDAKSKDNAQVIRLLIYTKSYDKSKESTMAKDLRMLASKQKGYNLSGIEKYIYSVARPMYMERKDTMMTLLTTYNPSTYRRGHLEKYDSRHFYIEFLKAGIDMQKKMYQFIYVNENKSEWEKALIENVGFDRNSFLDVIGTHYLRMGKWEEAIGWLRLVDMKYIKTQNISEYMLRDYRIGVWEKVQNGYNPKFHDEIKNLKENKKLSFCQDILKTISTYNHSSGIERDKAALNLAAMYSQASEFGHCWWLARYSNGRKKGEYDIDLPTDFDFVQNAKELLHEVEQSKDGTLSLIASYAQVAIAPNRHVLEVWTQNKYNLVHSMCKEDLLINNLDLIYNKIKMTPNAPKYITKCDNLNELLKASGKKI